MDAIYHNALNNLAFIAQGHCYLWKPKLIWLHALSDGLIALAYFSIPIALLYFVQRRRDLPYPWIFQLFGVFIITCGLTHAMGIWTLWNPTYWVSGWLKVVTALVSLTTAGALMLLIPKALTLPGRGELEMLNEALERQVRDRTQSLRQSKNQYKSLLDSVNGIVWELDVATFCFTIVSQKAEDILGYSAEQWLNEPDFWSSHIHPDDRDQTVEFCSQMVQLRRDHEMEYRMIAADGRVVWLWDQVRVLTEDDRPVKLQGIMIDISDRKATEAALAESRQRYQDLVENSPDIIERFDLQLRHLYVSPTLTEITGIRADAFLGKTCRELGMDETMINTWESAAVKLLATGEKQTIEFSTPTLSGERSFEMAIAPEWAEDGTIQSILCISRDITDRKLVEQALKTQRDFNQLIAEITSRFVNLSPEHLDAEIERTLQLVTEVTQIDTSYLFRFDDNNRTISMTHEWCQPHFSPQIALAQKIPLTVFPWSISKLKQGEILYVPNYADLPPEAEIDQRGFQQFNLVAALLVPLVGRSGVFGTIGFASFSQPLTWSEETIRLLTVLTQTIANAQQQAEDEHQLAISEERLRLALSAANQGLYDLNIQTGEAVVTPEYALMLGYDPATFEETNARWIERLHPDDRAPITATYQAYIAGTLPEYKVEFRQRTQSGDYKWILSMGKVVAWDADGQPLRMLGTHTDISDRKQAAAALQAREEQLRLALEAANQQMYDVNLKTNQVILSPEYIRNLGYTPEEFDCSAEGWRDRLHPDERDTVLQTLADYGMSKRTTWQIEYRQRTKAGDYKWILSLSKVVAWDDKGTPTRVIGTLTDVTERKQAETQLQDLTNRLKLAAQAAKMGIWDWDIKRDRLTWDERMYELYGLPNEVVPTYEVWEAAIHPDDILLCRRATQQALMDQDEGKNEFRVVLSNGDLRYLESYFLVQRDAEGHPLRMIGVNLDISERKQAEANLRQQQELLQSVVENIPVMLAFFDANSQFQWVNRTWERILGWTLEEAKERDLLAEFYPDPEYRRHVANCIQTADGIWEDFRICLRDGTFLDTAWANIRLSNGTSIGIGQDISDRKRAEEARLQAEKLRLELNLLESILDNVLAGYWDDNFATGVSYWSPGLKRMFGYEDHELPNIPELWQSLIFAEDLPGVLERFDRHVQSRGKVPYYNEVRYRHKDGSTVWVICSGQVIDWDAEGQPLRMIGCHVNITKQKQTEAQLKNLSDRLTLALRSGAIGTWNWDLCREVNWDDGMYKIYGLQHLGRNAIYQDWIERVHSDDRARVEAALQAAVRGERDYDLEFRIYHTDGELRWIKATALVQRDAMGNALCMTGINYDITEVKQAEATILQTTVQLQASNRELEAFAYSVSHDLRAPLRAIDGFSQALLEDYGDRFDDEAKDYFARIRHNVQRMGNLIDDLLSLSRVSRFEMQCRTVNLSELVQEQAHELQMSDPQRQVEFVITQGAIVAADPTLMRVVITNLLENAWKFTSHHSSARIEFGIIKQNEQSIYFVRDDGAGFDMAYAAKLFGVFQRLHNTHEFPGTGIGLATVQRIIHRHGGQVWAEGMIEHGATIYFTIPDISLAERI